MVSAELQPARCSSINCHNTLNWTLVESSSHYADWQKLRLQEPSGELHAAAVPRSLDVIARYRNLHFTLLSLSLAVCLNLSVCVPLPLFLALVHSQSLCLFLYLPLPPSLYFLFRPAHLDISTHSCTSFAEALTCMGSCSLH